MAAQLKVLQPGKYHSLYLEKDIRPDGRKLSTFGETSINMGCISSANGSALINLRETSVICGIKAELANPAPEHPNEGFIVPNIDFPAVCSSAAMPGPPPFFVQLYSQLLAQLVKSTSLINPADLCIAEGKLCWCLYVDISCLNFCGNILDAVVLAFTSAIANVTLPDVSIQEDKIEVKDSIHPLKIGELIFSSTFGAFEKGIVADPTREEESLAKGLVTVFMQEKGLLCNIFMQHGSIDEVCLKQCIRLSKKRSAKLGSMVRELKSDIDN